ncbi:MAG TPA: iron-containing alcohol dehydrogenase [Pirellulales bacterium]|jgi:alcohol dehydrogenase
MTPFDFYPRTRIVFGPRKVETLGQLAGELGARRALVVSDPGIVAAGHAARGIAALTAADIEVQLFDGVAENPTTDHVAAGLKIAKRFEPELLVGLGGGSSMDCAKGINFLYTNGGEIRDYWGIGKATGPMLPMIAVPTTAGTGSETQSFALISDAKTHVKMACGDKKASFRIALLDPELTLTQPPRVTALTGIDAVAHALESYVARTRNSASVAFSREAWLLLGGNFSHVLAEPTNLDARGGMQLGASFAGLAIENSMLGAAHALANPLTAEFGIAHGQAVGMMLPHVIRFNGEQFGNLYFELLECTAGGNGFPAPAEGYRGLADFVADLLNRAALTSRLREFEIGDDRLPALASDAAKQWTASFNPRPVEANDLLSLYRAAY